jgi:acyl-CoA reductase-like NAD-dependent aldehyde dehydrogenase
VLEIKSLLSYVPAVFAPIVLVMRYSSVQEAIEIANSTRYGLGASVFGPDQSLAVKVARRLECGMVAVNDFGVFYVSRWSWLCGKVYLLSLYYFS